MFNNIKLNEFFYLNKGKRKISFRLHLEQKERWNKKL